jgi:hypothetical protein
VCYAKEDPNAPNPSFKNLQEWKAAKSTKMDVTAKICRYYLSRDDVPDISFDNGKPVFPKVPAPQPGDKATQNRKILIFSEYPSVTGILVQVRLFYQPKRN